MGSLRVVLALDFAGCHDGDDAGALGEAGAEDAVGVLEHAVLERHYDELRVLEARLDDAPDVLRVAQVQRRVHLVQDVHGRRLELEERQDQRQRDQRSVFRSVFVATF